MEWQHTIEDSLCHIECSGELAFDGATALLETVIADPALDGVQGILIEDKGTPFYPVADEINVILSHFATLSAEGRRHLALVVENDVQFGVGRLIEAQAQMRDISFRVFHSVAEAKEWLGPALVEQCSP